MMINIDGEYGGDAPMVFKNLKQHIEMFANTEKIPLTAITFSKTPAEVDASEHFVEGVEHLAGQRLTNNGQGQESKK